MHGARVHAPFRLLRGDLPAIVLLALAGIALILYASDHAVFRYRVSRGADSALSSVTIFYAAAVKGGKVSVFYDQPQTQPCVRSLFPQGGYEPCWYLRRHTVRVVD